MPRHQVGKRVSFDGPSYLREHLPGSLIGHPDFILQLVSRDTNFKETNRTSPLRDGRPRLFKDGARSLDKRIFTASTLVFKAVSLSQSPDSLKATAGTSNTSWPTNSMKKLAALAFVSNMEPMLVRPHGAPALGMLLSKCTVGTSKGIITFFYCLCDLNALQ